MCRGYFFDARLCRTMHKPNTYLQTIRKAYPELSIQNTRLNTRKGQYNDILIINADWIFRFPRYAEGIESIINKVRTLSTLRLQAWATRRLTSQRLDAMVNRSLHGTAAPSLR